MNKTRVTPALIAIAKEEAAYVNNEKNAFLAAANRAENQANTSSRTLSGQLLLIAGAILTFSATAIISDGSISKLSTLWHVLIIAAWAFLAISAALGIAQIYHDYEFFFKWHKYNVNVAGELKTGKYISTNINEATNKFKKPADSSGAKYLILQMIALALGAFIFLAVVSNLVWTAKTNGSSQHLRNRNSSQHYKKA